MFANLKNKLIEEVKASPSKFQQFASAAQAAVASSTSTTPCSDSTTTTTTTNENFFSITEEDTPQNSPYKPLKLPPGAIRGRSTPLTLNNGTGAIPRTRKLSNSSMASDISFRLPSYDSPAIYHLQSDLDETASEMDDSASTSKLDVITKEQLFDAYKKSLERYHKYRCRYTDLAKKYKDLEHDSTKARSVLVETQEKAIRRISELREQCSLEQQAKAHLEEALRIEMDDMQCKMQAYQTKLTLLGENPDNITAALSGNLNNESASLIDLDHITQDTINGNETNNFNIMEQITDGSGQNSEQIRNLERLLEEREQQLNALKDKMEKSNATIELLRKQEEENALFLAQTKQAIHSELINKENEVKKLTDTIKQMQNDLQTATTKEKQLSGQLGDNKELKEKLKNTQTAKQEADAKIMATEHILVQLKEQFITKEKALAAAEERLAELTNDSEQKTHDLRKQNAQLSEMVNRYQQNEVSLAEIDNELNRTKNENDNLKVTINANEQKLLELERQLNLQNEHTEQSKEQHLAMEERLNAEQTKIEQLNQQLEDEKIHKEKQEFTIKQLETQLRILSEQNSNNDNETIVALQSEHNKTSAELSEKLKALQDQISNKEKELKTTSNKLNKQKKQYETQQNRVREQNEEIEKLKVELNKHAEYLQLMQNEASEREVTNEREKNELKAQVTNILHEISQMEEQMRVVQQSHAELEVEKRNLETKIEKMQRQTQDANAGTQRWRELLNEAEEKLIQVELKQQNVESENSQLAESNCLLEEKTNRMEKLLVEKERQQTADETTASEMRLKLETAEDAIQKLNEKMSQVLDENSRMQNAQELMDHDFRTLQDKLDALEKEKLLVEDTLKCLESETEQLKEIKRTNETNLKEIEQQFKQAEEKYLSESTKSESLVRKSHELQAEKEQLANDTETIRAQLSELQATQFDDSRLRDLLEAKEILIEKLQNEYREIQEQHEKQEQDISEYKLQLSTFDKMFEILEHKKEETALLTEQRDNLSEELSIANEKIIEETDKCLQLEMERKILENFKQQYEIVNSELLVLKEKENQLNEELAKQKDLYNEQLAKEIGIQGQLENSNAANGQLQIAQEELRQTEDSLRLELTTCKENYEQQIKQLETRLGRANEDVEKLHESNDAFQVEIDKLNSKHQLQVKDLADSLQHLQQEHVKVQAQFSSNLNNAEKMTNYDQMEIENEYLNKHIKQLESELEEHKAETRDKLKEVEELKEKLKSLQCEQYVLKENAEKHDAQLQTKQLELVSVSAELETLKTTLENERAELKRQSEHAAFITEQNDHIQKDLLNATQHSAEIEQRLANTSAEMKQLQDATSNDVVAKEKQITDLRNEIERNQKTIEALNNATLEIKTELKSKEHLQEEIVALKIELDERVNAQQLATHTQAEATAQGAKQASNDAEHLRKINAALQNELEDLKHKSTAKISNLQEEIEDLLANARQTSERIMELEQLRAGLQAQKLLGLEPSVLSAVGPGIAAPAATTLLENRRGINESVELRHEKEELESKLKAIMNEVQDVSNRNIFLEQKCENYLILEQSNERLKLQNAKLSRQLDETLVSMQHNENISANTEFEYLKNIMFQYLTGSANGNNETLVKVISAVLKFTPQQTQVALEKEHQRRSLINKIL